MDEKQVESKWANKKSNYIVGGIFVLAIIGLGIYVYNHQSTKTQNNPPQVAQENTATPIATTTPTSTPPSVGTTAKNLSYTQAVATYKNRFQFSKCQGTPISMVIKKGNPVMLDNRDPIAHTFKADTQTFKIAGYGYFILYPEVLGNLNVTCDGINRVTLNVEK
jgi:hypothetical protein